MNATTVAVDLAKDVFELAFSAADGRVVERRRWARAAFVRCFDNLPATHVVMESCGTAQYWARRFLALGHHVTLLPVQHVQPFRRGNKTDRNDTTALLDAQRIGALRPVPVKSIEQQTMQALHRTRSQWMATRTARLNGLRGFLREFGIVIPLGAARVRPAVAAALADAENGLTAPLRAALANLRDEVIDLELRIAQCDRDINALAKSCEPTRRLRSIPGIGVLTATALWAAVVDIHAFRSGRYLAAWLGLTPREHSSGNTRRLGRITRRGDTYLRTLLIHGARSVLSAACRAQTAGKPLDRLRSWALQRRTEIGFNKTAVALANKLARIAWATWQQEHDFQPDHVSVAPQNAQ